jgi:putative chitinase
MADNVDSKGNKRKYEGFPFISNIDGYVQNELANRSLQRIRPITPFIKVTPGFSPDGSESSKIVLKGIEAPNDRDPSTYTFKELYRPNSFFRPLAGIKSISVDYLNAYGSIKKVSISWICHTLEDLERLSPYFLNPGQTMFIEWGWSNYAANVINNSPKINLADYLDYVRQRRLESNGNYDGMLGIVVNYSFTLNRDGGFDCVTEVVSSGFVMEGITVPNQLTQDASGNNSKVKTVSSMAQEQKEKEDEIDKKEKTEIKVLKTLQSFIENGFYTQIKNDIESGKFSNVDIKHDYFLLRDLGKNGIPALAESTTGRTVKKSKEETQQSGITGGFSLSPTGKGNIGTTTKTVTVEIPLRASVYASWGYLEDYVLNPHLAISADGAPDKVLFGFDSRGSKISSHENLRTTDLGVFVLPYANPVNAGDTVAPSVPNFKADETISKNLEFGYVRRLLINVQLFREVMLNATTINDGVLQLFTEINNACINYWQFRLVPLEGQFDDIEKARRENFKGVNSSGTSVTVSPTSSNTAGATSELGSDRKDAIIAQKIVDINYGNRLFEEIDLNKSLYMFRTKTFALQDSEGNITPNVTSVVRNLSFQSKLSNQAALNVFYSAQNKDGRVMGSPSTNTFQSLYNFGINGIDYSKAKDTFSAGPFEAIPPEAGDETTNTNVTDPGIKTELILEAQYPYGEALTRFLPSKEYGYWVKVADKNLTGIEGMKMAVLLSVDGKTPPATSEALVPLECQVELEGISGIMIGDIFTIDHIPIIYQKHGTFQVTGITDTIDKNSWVTKLKAGFRVFRNIDYVKIKNIPTTYTENINSSIINLARKATVTPPDDLIVAMRNYGITDALEKAHFLSQCSHESGGFRFTEERADGSAYEGKKNLGNTQSGDGKRFKGRGYIQITGRYNYTQYNNYLHANGNTDDIIANPELVATKYAADSACFYWKYLGKVTPYAKQGSTPLHVLSVTKRINSAANGYDDRLARFNGYWAKLKDDNALYS